MAFCLTFYFHYTPVYDRREGHKVWRMIERRWREEEVEDEKRRVSRSELHPKAPP